MANNASIQLNNIEILKEEINKETSFNIEGLVNQLNFSNYLMPLYETVINSIQSIELGKIKKGYIEIYIKRAAGQKKFIDIKEAYNVQCIQDIIVSDNGEGFNDKNLKSFLKAYSTEKQNLGCKGVGHFTWLKTFREVRIESSFKNNKQILSREFTYKLPNGIQGDYQEKETNTRDLKTVIKLIDLKSDYFHKSNQKITTIAKKILEHCFYYLTLKNAPTIVVAGYDNEDLDEQPQSICLNELFKELYGEYIERKALTIKGNKFSLINVKMFDNTEESNHKIYFCANNRATEEYSIKSLTHLVDLDNKKLYDKTVEKNFYYVAYLSGEYFNQKADMSRTNLIIKTETSFDDPEYLTLSEIKKAVVPYLKKFVQPFLTVLNKERMKKIEQFIKIKVPQYNYLLNENEDFFSDIPLTANDFELNKLIRSKHYDKKLEYAEKFEAKINKLQQEESFQYKDYKNELAELNKKVGEANQADLAEYVTYRKIVLSLFEKYLAIDISSNKYFEEKVIHDLIYPMQSTSKEVSYDSHNLWLIDDRLAFSQFISSDKSLSAIKLNKKSRKEPDLLFFDSRKIYSEDNETSYLSSMSIMEFKRPERNNYSKSSNGKENPIEQIYDYIDDIKAGKVQNNSGRTIRLHDRTRFYGYVICDINDKIKEFAKKASLKQTPDNMGYFGYNSEYNCYIEVISFDKILVDAKKRNHILFKKLGLER